MKIWQQEENHKIPTSKIDEIDLEEEDWTDFTSDTDLQVILQVITKYEDEHSQPETNVDLLLTPKLTLLKQTLNLLRLLTT